MRLSSYIWKYKMIASSIVKVHLSLITRNGKQNLYLQCFGMKVLYCFFGGSI